ncbi:M15 family metallopeptidase [Sphingomonas sp. PB2P19]|uniref:M15 family metallopeptidase n=1 Tax=Sphingomonas rhamnosi TaxID=3096156 RepID=UPI002FCA6F3E
MLRRTLLLALAFTPAVAEAQLCAGQSAAIAPDGRAFGHLPYGDAPESELVTLPADDSVGGACVIRRDALPDLMRLFDAARTDPVVMGQLKAMSCHRSIERQRGVFCRGTDSPADRAISVAPPGYSEHATGYVLDFAVRPRGDCPDAEACMAATPAAKWLRANAPRFGFEQSFPGGNKQNVKWEPWHWRWVGVASAAPGAARARFVFARARRAYPANPGIDPVVVRVAPPPPKLFLKLPVLDAKKRH